MKDEDPLRPISLAEEFFEYAMTNKNASKFQYFVDELNKMPIDDRHKVFYNIRAKMLGKVKCRKCGSEDIEFK